MINTELYSQKKEAYTNELGQINKKDNLLVTIRSLLSVTMVLITIISLGNKDFSILFSLIPLGVTFFAVFKYHNKVQEKKTYLTNLIKVNNASLDRLNGNWTHFSNNGSSHLDPNHPYTRDLNIFGQGSLFQYINSTTTLVGEKKLALHLQSGLPHTEIPLRQDAIKELAPLVDWRQALQAQGLSNRGTYAEPKLFLEWAEKKEAFFKNANYLSLVYLLPFLTIGVLLLVTFDLLPLFSVLLLLIGHLLIVSFTEKRIGAYFKQIEKIVTRLEGFPEMIKLIEAQSFDTTFLKQIKDSFKSSQGTTSEVMATLVKISDRISFRYSPLFHIPINIVTFWDLITIAKLEKWRATSGKGVRKWFEVLAELESLNCFAELAFNNPDWATPELSTSTPFVEARELGHPLIHAEKRITNDFNIGKNGSSFIITGSNMSGKSTFLRTVGINLVLAYCGSVVCSKSFKASYMEVYSSMQTSDSLEEAVSSFYAELKRIKLIVDAAKTNKPLIYLLDEIFKGTNSKDRIFGAKTIITQLTKLNTIGLVTTHDLELGQLTHTNPDLVKNFHFTDKIEDNKINFDYKMRPGISPTTNAVALMKMIGIDVDGDSDL